MRPIDPYQVAQRRFIEDELMALGDLRHSLSHQDSWNRERIRRLVGPAREAGITVRDISRMTGLSAQTVHTWMRNLMRPIADIHFGVAGPTPALVEQAVLRVMGQDPARDWQPHDVSSSIPAGWPAASAGDVAVVMEHLARGHMIWDGDRDGSYRVAPPG